MRKTRHKTVIFTGFGNLSQYEEVYRKHDDVVDTIKDCIEEGIWLLSTKRRIDQKLISVNRYLDKYTVIIGEAEGMKFFVNISTIREKYETIKRTKKSKVHKGWETAFVKKGTIT